MSLQGVELRSPIHAELLAASERSLFQTEQTWDILERTGN
jgi:hypothetical protein